jgi:hypothetical protein
MPDEHKKRKADEVPEEDDEIRKSSEEQDGEPEAGDVVGENGEYTLHDASKRAPFVPEHHSLTVKKSCPYPTSGETPKKKRGRPPGSKNKPKSSATGSATASADPPAVPKKRGRPPKVSTPFYPFPIVRSTRS